MAGGWLAVTTLVTRLSNASSLVVPRVLLFLARRLGAALAAGLAAGRRLQGLGLGGGGLCAGGPSSYDYVVVGAGSAGCAVAARLSEDPARAVLLLEAGAGTSHPLGAVPLAAREQQRSAWDWGYVTAPQTNSCQGLEHKQSFWPRGLGLGGSSVTNYMAWVRGNVSDFVAWPAGWRDGAEWARWFRAVERCAFRADPQTRGVSGPVSVTEAPSPREVSRRFVQACAEAGLGIADDYNAPGEQLGAALFQRSCTPMARRCDTATAYLTRDVRRRPNLTVATGCMVERVEVDAAAGRCLGVRVRPPGGGPAVMIAAAREVVLCAGAVGSPQILQLSGIGPRAHLESVGVPVKRDLPGVGANLQDHVFVPDVFHARRPFDSVGDHVLSLWNLARYFLFGKGPITSNMIEAVAFVRTGARSDLPEGVPDLQLHFMPGCVLRRSPEVRSANVAARFWPDFVDHDSLRGYVILPTLLHPKSTGSVKIASADPSMPPVIDPNYLADPKDVETLVEGQKLTFELAETPALKAATERLPHHPQLVSAAVPFLSDAYHEAVVRHFAVTVYHPVGTCKMGESNDPTAVVTPELKVVGVKGLRVADASVFPTITSGNTNAPVIALAERAASIIKSSGV